MPHYEDIYRNSYKNLQPPINSAEKEPPTSVICQTRTYFSWNVVKGLLLLRDFIQKGRRSRHQHPNGQPALYQPVHTSKLTPQIRQLESTPLSLKTSRPTEICTVINWDLAGAKRTRLSRRKHQTTDCSCCGGCSRKYENDLQSVESKSNGPIRRKGKLPESKSNTANNTCEDETVQISLRCMEKCD